MKDKPTTKKLSWLLLGISIGIASLTGVAYATPIQWTDYTNPGVVTTEPGMHPDQYGLLENNAGIPGYEIPIHYMWYCGGANTCSPSQGPNQVQFHQEFTVADSSYRQYWFGHGNLINPADNPATGERYALSIIADDYYALYINNQLVHYSWLNDGSGTNAPHFSDQPFNLTVEDIIPYIVSGRTNVIDIFACNGNVGNNLPAAPGSTTDGGLNGCPNPSSRLYNWLLINGGFTKEDNTPGGAINADVNFISGDESTSAFQVRAVAVPEPSIVALFVIGFLGLAVSKRRNHNRFYSAFSREKSLNDYCIA